MQNSNDLASFLSANSTINFAHFATNFTKIFYKILSDTASRERLAQTGCWFMEHSLIAVSIH
jgi:hypothetical protein